MSKSIIELKHGTETVFITSGKDELNAITSITLTESVNGDEELTLGSACASILEATIFTPHGGLEVTAGDEVTLFKVDDAGAKTQKGVFILEKPTRSSANTIKITGYDRMIKLDQDLTAWLSSLAGWPYTLLEFAGMICTACGLKLVTADIPNGDFLVPKFQYANVTGRQLMKWVGEICCRFCRADANGNIELAWYEPSGKHITPSGDTRYFAKGLTYETYEVAPIETVQVKLADSDAGALWPGADEGVNAYVISGNPILLADLSPEAEASLQVIEGELAGMTYTPCKVSISAEPQIRAGSIVEITDSNEKTITAYVMTKTSTGRKDTLECTGSHRRDSASAVNSRSQADKVNEMMLSVKSLDGKKVVSMINMSEEGVKIQAGHIKLEGLVTANKDFHITTDGSLEAVNATITGTITATSGNIGGCLIEDGKLWVPVANISGTIEAGKIVVKSSAGSTLLSAGDNKVQIAGWNVDNNSFYSGDSFAAAECFFCTGSTDNNKMSIGGSDVQSGWVLKAGGHFGVTKSGECYLNLVHIAGGSIKIPLDGFAGTMEAGSSGVGCTDDSSAVFLLPDGIQYSASFAGGYLLQISELNTSDVRRTLIGTWYIGALGSTVQVTSDRNAKYEVQPQPDVYSQVFDKLQPVSYKYKNGTSGRIHTGFIAQDVEEAVLSCGLSTQEFAAVCYELDNEGRKVNYGIRYEEIVSMLTYEVQKLKRQVAEILPLSNS